MLVSKPKGVESWVLRRLNNEHKCLQTRKVNACTFTFLSYQLLDQVYSNPEIPVKSVQEQFQRQYELGISRLKAYRARSKARRMVQGDYTTQYGMLRDYVLELKKQNPGTTVKIQVEEGTDTNLPTRRFKRIYVCFGALKQGFKAIGRDLLGLDGAFMKGPFPGQILSAVGVDPNNGIYPVCLGVVETENQSSWTWFVENLADDLDLGPNSCFTFMSDRQKGLLPAIENLFPCAEHRYCVRHIHENFKATYRGKLYKDMLYKCAHATTIPEFETAMDELKAFNPDAHLWLSNIDRKHWSKSHFSGRPVSDMLINNMCEVFNGKIVEGRYMPIISALEYIREYLRTINVLEVIDKSEGLLTPTATTELQNIRTSAAHYTVQWNGGDLY